MTRGIFVSGTDTGVGKTIVAAALLRSLRMQGYAAIGMKPVAAGLGAGEKVNADVRALFGESNVGASLADVNPYVFAPAIAPHLAAREAGQAIDIEKIAAAYERLAATAEAVVVEGAGGLLVPLDEKRDMLDIPVRLGLPVLLVVGLRLGCLSHALLSSLALRSRGVSLVGWVANRIDPTMSRCDENIGTLVARLPAPLIAEVGWSDGVPPAVTFDRKALQRLGFARP